MATRIIEFYGFAPLTEQSIAHAQEHRCPFVGDRCIKKVGRGACSLQQGDDPPVIICPNRLYEQDFASIRKVAREAFGDDFELLPVGDAERRRRAEDFGENIAVVFGKYFGGEVGIPSPPGEDGIEGKGSFKIDYIISKVDNDAQLDSFVAIEVQTIDTTDSYAQAADAYAAGNIYESERGDDLTPAGFNWENVSKRILPQLIYKGHALRREALCKKGLYFIVPHAVFEKIRRRIGSKILEYPQGSGTITFNTYSLSEMDDAGVRRIIFERDLTTTVEQIAFAFVSPQNLPALGIYETTIRSKLHKQRRRRTI